jgi:hypothetical protein
VRDFIDKRFAGRGLIEKFSKQLDFMLDNLQGLGYLTLAEDGDHVTLDESIRRLLSYRSVDPLFGDFAGGAAESRELRREAARARRRPELPWAIIRNCRIPEELERARCRSRCSSR